MTGAHRHVISLSEIFDLKSHRSSFAGRFQQKYINGFVFLRYKSSKKNMRSFAMNEYQFTSLTRTIQIHRKVWGTHSSRRMGEPHGRGESRTARLAVCTMDRTSVAAPCWSISSRSSANTISLYLPIIDSLDGLSASTADRAVVFAVCGTFVRTGILSLG